MPNQPMLLCSLRTGGVRRFYKTLGAFCCGPIALHVFDGAGFVTLPQRTDQCSSVERSRFVRASGVVQPSRWKPQLIRRCAICNVCRIIGHLILVQLLSHCFDRPDDSLWNIQQSRHIRGHRACVCGNPSRTHDVFLKDSVSYS